MITGLDYKPCRNPETCDEEHNECTMGCEDGGHHYGCECECCMWFYWSLKH